MSRPSAATTIASVALFFSLAGTGLAADKYLIRSAKQIKPSVLNSLRGKKGPRGFQGLAGAVGPAGAAGAAGTAGASFTTSDVTVVDGPPVTLGSTGSGATNGSVATCPAGSVVLGGGFEWIGNTPDKVTVSDDGPTTTAGDGWNAIATNFDSGETPTLRADAICGS